MGQQGLLFLALFVGVIAVANLLAARRRAAREAGAAEFAARAGFQPLGEVNPFLGSVAPVRGPAPSGEPRVGISATTPGIIHDLGAGRGTLRNLMRGETAAGETLLFDYRPLAAASASGLSWTVAGFAMDRVPEFQLSPQPRFALGVEDQDFADRPDFSKRFLLTARDPAAVRVLFSPAVLDAFESLPAEREWYVQGGAGWLLLMLSEGDQSVLVEQGVPVAAALRAELAGGAAPVERASADV